MMFSPPPTASKVMSEFQRDGLIEVRNRRISVTLRLANMRLNNYFPSLRAAA
jgi:hypothetical protein